MPTIAATATPEPTARVPNCWRCVHFLVTHQPGSPYGCRSMGFSSRYLPHLEVIRIDGEPCRSFTPKPPRVGTN